MTKRLTLQMRIVRALQNAPEGLTLGELRRVLFKEGMWFNATSVPPTLSLLRRRKAAYHDAGVWKATGRIRPAKIPKPVEAATRADMWEPVVALTEAEIAALYAGRLYEDNRAAARREPFLRLATPIAMVDCGGSSLGGIV